ncbi:MAG: type transport system permease protein [Thermoleophilaceae bacterium]|jgi:ABC-2 type transport system permease protein|nr:type transport system permease protein [Thermoleophilaceae bacterium]
MASATATRAAPTAFGDDVRHFFNLTFTLAVTEWKLRFFGSVLGYLWTLMRPLLLFGVLYVVFTHVVKVGTEVPHYPVYLLCSIVLFQFFADSTSQGLQSLLQRESLLRKMRFPRMVIPLSVVLTNLFNLGMNMIAVLVFLFANGIEPRWTWLLVPVLVLALIVLATGAAMLTSALYVRFRDLAPIWEIVLQIAFYASPVLYVISQVPSDFQHALAANPLGMVMTQTRKWVIDPDAPSAAEAIGGYVPLLIPIGVILAVFALGFWVFERETPHIAENL